MIPQQHGKRVGRGRPRKTPAHVEEAKARWSKLRHRKELAATFKADPRPTSQLVEEFLAKGGQIKKVPQGCSGLSS